MHCGRERGEQCTVPEREVSNALCQRERHCGKEGERVGNALWQRER